jgi:type III restriction enzyme
MTQSASARCASLTSNQIQIMVINIQSFQKDTDKDSQKRGAEEAQRHKPRERPHVRRRPIEFIQAANPIVIIDEPSVDTTRNQGRRYAPIRW